MPRYQNSEEGAEVELYVYNLSDAAFLVGESIREPEDDREKYWLPKSQVLEMSEPRGDGSRTFTVREWWARKNGLI